MYVSTYSEFIKFYCIAKQTMIKEVKSTYFISCKYVRVQPYIMYSTVQWSVFADVRT